MIVWLCDVAFGRFTGHFSHSLIFSSIVGFCFQLLVWTAKGGPNYSHPTLPFFGLVMSCWAVLFLQFWKNKEATRALQWGMVNFEEKEIIRPNFVGIEITSLIDGSPYQYFPEAEMTFRQRLTSSVVAVYLALVLSALAGIYVFKYTSTGPFVSYEASALNATLITVATIVFRRLAAILTGSDR